MNVEQIIHLVEDVDVPHLGARMWTVFRPEYLSDGYICYPGVMVCPICLVQWAQLDIIGKRVYEVRPVSCTECNYISVAHPVPGSIIANDITPSGVDWALLDSLPLELVKREFDLTLKATDLWNAQDTTSPVPRESGTSSTANSATG